MKLYALALIGLVLAAAGVFSYKNPGAVSCLIGSIHPGGRSVANAGCTTSGTKTQNDEVFFVSCGGIY